MACTPRYGGKRRLFEKVLERYQELISARLQAVVTADSASLPAIRRFFSQFLEVLESSRSRLGCLMCATASEVSTHDGVIAGRVADHLAKLREAIHAAISRAKANGEIAGDSDPDMLADYFVGALLGLMSFARSPSPRARVKNYVCGILAFIDAISRKPARERRSRKSPL